MSDNYGNTNWGGFPSNPLSTYDPNNMMSQSHFSTLQSSNMTSQAHDNDNKLGSITEYLDSGIGSLSIQEEERQNQVLEKIGESTEMCRSHEDSTEMCRSHEDSTEMCRRQDDLQIGSQQDQDSIREDSGISGSMTSDCNSIEEKHLPFVPDDKGYSSLHFAILNRDVEHSISFIEDCPAPELLNFHTREVHTALHLAIFMNLPEIVRFLVVYGADVSMRDRRGNTALHTACELGYTLCAQMLLLSLNKEENIGFQTSDIPQDVNEKNYEGLTPLHLATIYDHYETVGLLLQQRNIRVNIRDSTSGRTALHHALERRSINSFYLLLKKSANVNATTYDGCSPLHLAVGLGLEKETRFLMTRGANVEIKTSDKTRAWDLAKTQKLKDALQYSTLQMTQMSVKQR